MYIKIIANISLIIILSIFQIAFISGLPSWFGEINLILIVLILLLGFANLKVSYWWAFGAGFMLDNYLFVPFGANIISLLITVALANFLLTNFLTNRSLYAFLSLTSIAAICNEFCLYIIVNSINLILSRDLIFTIGSQAIIYKLYGLGINLLLIGICLYALNYFGAKFKPVFLSQRKPHDTR